MKLPLRLVVLAMITAVVGAMATPVDAGGFSSLGFSRGANRANERHRRQTQQEMEMREQEMRLRATMGPRGQTLTTLELFGGRCPYQIFREAFCENDRRR